MTISLLLVCRDFLCLLEVQQLHSDPADKLWKTCLHLVFITDVAPVKQSETSLMSSEDIN